DAGGPASALRVLPPLRLGGSQRAPGPARLLPRPGPGDPRPLAGPVAAGRAPGPAGPGRSGQGAGVAGTGGGVLGARAAPDRRRRDAGRRQPPGRGHHRRPGGARLVIRVLIVDDHPVVRQGLTELLGGAGDIDVVGAAANAEEAAALDRQLTPDVVLMDISMP